MGDEIQGVGPLGYKQFLTAKERILDAYDNARTQAGDHTVQVLHGRVAEAEIRRWLSEFLPKRYGVTSGYVISQGIDLQTTMPHFDVIIYDQIESPVLWIEKSPDSSEAGRSKAIPAEHVRLILEVKSSWDRKNAKDAVEHLLELGPLVLGADAPNERYKRFLPASFACGAVFVELRKENEHDSMALSNLIPSTRLRNRFYGAAILRGEGRRVEDTGRVRLLYGRDIPTMAETRGSLLGMMLSEPQRVASDLYVSAMVNWTHTDFSLFAFDLVAILNGTYEANLLSSFHGIRFQGGAKPSAAGEQ